MIDKSFDALGEEIVIVHAKDTFLNNKMSVFLEESLLGTGNLDIDTYLVRLSQMKWPRTLLIEHFPTEKYAEATLFVREKASALGMKIHGDI